MSAAPQGRDAEPSLRRPRAGKTAGEAAIADPAALAVGPVRSYVRGPGRAVLVLSLNQILSWGMLIYSPVLILPHLAADRGWSLAFCMAGFSLGMITSGLVAPRLGGLIDTRGGHLVMGPGALSAALGFAGLTLAFHPVLYFACWLLIGVAMSTTLYDAAFTTLGRIFGANARRQIIFVTFAGGFASTVAWPATHILLDNIGWRGTYLVFAAICACVIAPLNGFALPRIVAPSSLPHAHGGASAPEPPATPASGRLFVLIAAGFALHAFMLSGVTSNLLGMLERGGIDAATVVFIGALFGPAQVIARMFDFLLANRTHPLWIARGAVALMALAFAVLSLAGISVPAAAAFSIAFGAANGVITIARGALPLQIFGAVGYGRVLGRIARPASFVQASAPFVVALALQHLSARTVLALGMVCALASFTCFMAVRRPQPR